MRPTRTQQREAATALRHRLILVCAGLVAGYLLGMILMETADRMFYFGHQHSIETGPGQSKQPIHLEGHGDTSQQAAITPRRDNMAVKLPGAGGTNMGTEERPTAQSGGSGAGGSSEHKHPGDTIHSLLTSNGSPYQNIQSRIMYGTYKIVQKMPGGEKMTGFTRILHRSKNDELMEEMPTYRVNPLHPVCDVYCDFPVADRPNAVRQWIEAAEKDPKMIQGAWLLLIEADYVWMKPMKVPCAYSSALSMQYHFDYVMPEFPGVPEALVRTAGSKGIKYTGKVPASGCAPALLRFEELKKITPFWEAVTDAVEKDDDAKELLGWIREMYTWDVGVVAAGVKMDTQEPKKTILIAQPPHDTDIGNACILHYTWGAIYNDSNGQVYKWDKREYTEARDALKVPHLPLPPQPFVPNKWHLQGKEPVTKEMHELLTAMLTQMNKAIDTLPDLTSKALPAKRR